jgi:aminoglycoside N3'-acetyltransferase
MAFPIGSVATRFKYGTKALTFAQVSILSKAEQSSGYVLLLNYEHNSLTHSHPIVDWSVTCVAI